MDDDSVTGLLSLSCRNWVLEDLCYKSGELLTENNIVYQVRYCLNDVNDSSDESQLNDAFYFVSDN